jgi:hypothetical protein
MKIVRLESKPNLTQTQFQNDLSIPVQIKSNGEVALKSITFNLHNLKFNIPKNKYKFEYTIGEDEFAITRTNYIPKGLYEISDFFRILRILLNYQLTSDQELDSDLGFGFEWNIEYESRTDGYFTIISFYRNEQLYITTENIEIQRAEDATENNISSMIYDEPYFYRNEAIATNTDYNSGLKTIIENNRGAWNTSLTISNRDIQDIKNSNWVYGIGSMTALNRNSYNSLAEQLYVGMGVKNTNYVIKKNGVFQNVLIEGETISPLPNDVLDIYKRLDGEVIQVMYKIQRGNDTYELEGDIITVQSPITTINTADTYLVLKVENDAGKIRFSDITMNPTGTKELLNGQYIDTTNKKTIYNTNFGDVEPSFVGLGMKSDPPGDPYEFSKILGFRSNIYEKTAINGYFESRNRIDYNLFPSDLVIEIDELDLDGYDQGVKMSRNIVMTIPASELRQAINQLTIDSLDVSYTEPAQFLFIGMNNAENNKTLSNLTIRASINGKLLDINGGMSATLLFRDDRDKKVMI